jgi:putative transcriptional regulator
MINQIHSPGESLAGSFLISTPQMPDSRFEEHVIYICAHNNEGTMGVAINQPNAAFSMIEVLRGANMPIPETGLPPVHIGGPVELESAFILYLSEYKTEHKIDVSDTIALTRETRVLEDIANNRGPEDYLFILGYAGWGPGQLEAELGKNGWLTVPSSDDIIFRTPDESKWKAAAMQLGIDIEIFEDVIGVA